MASRADDYLLQCSKAIPDEILDAAEVFWSRLRKLENGCWVYGNSTREYGDFRGFSAHRVAYTLMFGAVQLGLVVAHKCDNKPCCNPEHLEAVTFGKNIRDAVAVAVVRNSPQSNLVETGATGEDGRSITPWFATASRYVFKV